MNQKVFLITDDDVLREAVSTSAARLHAIAVSHGEWSDAKDALFKDRFDAVCVDYDAIKVEGLDAFILLDNILQKEQTQGTLLLREASPRAAEFISSLDAFRDSIELDGAEPDPDLIATHLEALLNASTTPQATANAQADAPVSVEVHLPSLGEGVLGKVSLARLLYGLTQACASGVLHLESGSFRRRFLISEGSLINKPSDAFSNIEMLASAFAWQEGSYRFEPCEVAERETVAMHEFIYKSIERHVPQRRVMQTMMPYMQTYPTLTNLWSRRRDQLKSLEDLEVLQKFAAKCDGHTALEKALAALGSDATAGFKASLFAHHTDLIVLRGRPTPSGVNVQYDAAVEQAQQQRVEEEKKATKAYRATGTGRIDLEAELREFLRDVERATPYEIFDVWEGCGPEPVKAKFYEMVKSHHPDVYGGNVSGDVKQLAQEIFIAIKDAYTELRKAEKKQTRPDPRVPQKEAVDRSFATTTNSDAGNRAPPERTPPRPAERQRSRTSSPKSAGLDELSFGAEKANQAADSARTSRVERLNAKRSSTPIGLSREPSKPLVEGKSRKSPLREGTKERQARLDKIRRNSTPGSTPHKGDTVAQAKHAFNEGYKAFRENENKQLAYERFSTAYNLEPGNGKYMTFYGYLLFLNEPDKRNEAQKVLEKAIEIGDRQSLPDAHVFLGHILKVQDQVRLAVKHFKKALQLNPKSRQAQRELRLYHMRHKGEGDAGSRSFLKNLFKK